MAEIHEIENPTEQRNREMIEMLEDLLLMVRANPCRALSVFLLLPNGVCTARFSAEDCIDLISALELQRHQVLMSYTDPCGLH